MITRRQILKILGLGGAAAAVAPAVAQAASEALPVADEPLDAIGVAARRSGKSLMAQRRFDMLTERDAAGVGRVLDTSRRTGRTTEALRQAIEYAVAHPGERVLYVVPGHAMVDYAAGLVWRHWPEVFARPVDNHFGRRTLYFKPGGQLTIAAEGSSLLGRGQRFAVSFDHACEHPLIPTWTKQPTRVSYGGQCLIPDMAPITLDAADKKAFERSMDRALTRAWLGEYGEDL